MTRKIPRSLSTSRSLSTVLLTLCLVSTFHSSLQAQVKFGPLERRIITMTDERRNADSLIGFLSSPDIKVAWRAAIGIANIGDTSIREQLLEQFQKEKRDTIANAEAFALGILGPDAHAFSVMEEAALSHTTFAKVQAAARLAPPDEFAAAAKIISTLKESSKLTKLETARAYVELALRKAAPIRMIEDVEALTLEDDPEIRWRAAYIFSRSIDSTNLAIRFDRLKELLVDQGTPFSRMFAASALGKVHNAMADTALARAYRGETDWRVRVNIVNALSRFPRFDSLINSTYRSAILQATREDKNATSIGLVAMQNLEEMVLAGKLSSSDSTDLRSWISEFSGFNGEHEELATSVVASATPIAVRLSTPNMNTAIQTFAQSPDPLIRNIAVHAAGLLKDSAYFRNLLESTPMVGAFEQLARLEALDSSWQRAKRDPAFMDRLQRALLANIYRHLVIRISSLVFDPAVVTTALEHVKDSTIVWDTAFRSEANSYVAGYLNDFLAIRTRDQLVASVSAAHWLGMKSPTAIKLLRAIEDSAISWADLELLDSTRAALRDAGQKVVIRIPKQRRSNIDWAALEALPARWDVNFERSSIQVRMFPYYAPLTCLNMVRLARIQYFSGQKVHRVVPNFVIQSGDPTGTGWGGPGYSIRTEISPLEYDREGIAGIASSGKDTEGSQWFITELPTPHLSNHYTIWGEVVNGIQNVLPVQQGDKLESVTTANK